MNEEHSVSRRESLKTLGAAAAAVALAAPAAAVAQAVNAKDQAKPANVVDVAVERFTKGHSCAQAVFSAVAEQMGMDYQTAVKVSAGFGGGMYLGSVCGAVTGGMMAIGLKHGGLGAPSIQTAVLCRTFAERFKAQHKSVKCADLVGFDLGKIDIRDPDTLKKLFAPPSTPEARKEVEAMLGGRDFKAIFASCTGYVRDAATIVNEIVNGPTKT